VNRTDPVDEAHELIEQRAHCRRPSDEVVVDRAEGRTRVRLMAIRELATTASAAPERSVGHIAKLIPAAGESRRADLLHEASTTR
jgi:hypothetical protein